MIIVPFIDPTLYNLYFPTKNSRSSKSLKKTKTQTTKGVFLRYKRTHVICRNTVVLPFSVGKIWLVYNGQRFRKLEITESMVGHKIGEFVPTRGFYHYKKKKLNKWGKKTP